MKKLLLLTLAMVSCTGPRVSGPGINNRRAASLFEQASRELQCPEGELNGEYVQSIERNLHAYTVTGCGRQTTALLHCIAGVCQWRETPEQRATVDLQCPREQLSRLVQGDRFIMSGCGRVQAYGFVRGHLVPVVINLPQAQ